jgi:ABC-type nitrate/sulfonate/bicarbonate transport system substrate-binding protein
VASPAEGTPAQPVAAAPQLYRLPVVYNNQSDGMIPYWLTHEVGLFAKHGLDVELEFAQGNLAAHAMVAGQYEIGNNSISNVLTSAMQAAGLKMVASGSNKLGFALVAAKDITSPGQLRGKTFGIARLGDSSETATRLIARKVGLDPDTDITLLQVGNSPERYAALMTGNIQAMIASPMDELRARRDGYSVLADVATLNVDYSSGATTVRTEFLREHREIVKRFVMAYVEGIHYYKTHEDEAVALASQRLKTDDLEALRHAVRTYTSTLTPAKPYLREANLRPVIDEVAVTMPAVKTMPLDHFVDNSLLEEIDRSGFIDALYR